MTGETAQAGRKAAGRNAGRIYKACKWGMIEGAMSALERFQRCRTLEI